ncbi:MAG: DNA polymerase-4 [Candidatus Krumholzibacteriia bacterium]|jgi:DNA polymerase-4
MVSEARHPFQRAILHVDMDAFFASVEVLDDPSLRGKPVIVGGRPTDRGVVSAASYEARAFGVHSAMSTARAVKLCPDGVFLRGRMERYSEISKEVFAVFRDFTPQVEPLSIDEAFLDVSGCGRLFGSPENIGHLIKDRIASEVGIVASVGLAENKFLAKLASDLDKPDGFVIIKPGEARALLAKLPIGKLWGVGKVAQAKFAASGIHLISDLLARSRPHLVQEFGPHINHLLELAVGHDTREVVRTDGAKSIGNETTFSKDIANSEELRQVLHQLCDKVAHRLRTAGYLANTLTLKARYADFTTHTRSFTLPEPTDSDNEIREQACRLLEVNLQRRGRPLRLIGISAANLTRHKKRQPDLFPDAGKVRDRRLDGILDQVKGKYGAKLGRGLKKGPVKKRNQE